MEKSEAVRRFNEGKHFVETCLEDIASLDQSNDKELRKALRGTVMVEVSYKAAENFCKVCGYVIDGKDGTQKLKDKLFDLKEKVVQLYNDADRQNLVTIKTISKSIISEIKEVEELADDDHFIPDPIPETGKNGCLNIGENSGENENVESLTTDQIKEKINKIEPFSKAEASDIIPYGVYWTRLTKGEIKQANGDKKVFHVIDDKKCDFDLFCLCIERADISDIITHGNISFARLFMYYMANRFKDSGEYKKAAEKAFDLQVRLSAVPSKYRAEFYQLLGDEFPDSEPK